MHSAYAQDSDNYQQYRDWLRTDYPQADTLSEEQLIIRASSTINLEMREPEPMALLETMGKKVPEVKRYVAWLKTGDVDTLFRRQQDASRALAEYAERKYPGSFAARRAATDHLLIESTFKSSPENLSRFARLITEQEKTVAANPKDREAKGLLLEMKLHRINARNNAAEVADPKYFPEIWQIEQEVLDLYPPESEELSEQRIDLYSLLGPMKALPEDETSLQFMLPESTPLYNQQTLYHPISSTGFSSNGRFYLEKALDLAGKVYCESHPVMIALESSSCSYISSYIGVDENLIEFGQNTLDKASLIYPAGSVAMANLQSQQEIYRLLGTGSCNTDLYDRFDKNYKLAFGEESVNYFTWRKYRAISDFYANRSNLSAIEEEQKNAAIAYPGDPLSQYYSMCLIYMQMCDLMPADAPAAIEKLKNVYVGNHRPDPKSIDLGKQLIKYYRSYNYPKDSIETLMQIYLNDMERYYGADSPMMVVARCGYLGSIDDPARAEAGFKDLTRKVQDGSYNKKSDILNFVEESQGSCYYWHEQYAKALPIFKECYKRYPDSYQYCVAIANSIIRTGGPGEESERFLNKGIRLMDETHDSLFLDLPAYLMAADCKYESGDIREAVRIYERAMNLHNMRGGYANAQYFDIRLGLLNLYDKAQNRNGLSRILAEDRNMFMNMDINQFPVSPELISYLLGAARKSRNKNDNASWVFYQQCSQAFMNRVMFTSQMPPLEKIKMILPLIMDMLDYLKEIRVMYAGFSEDDVKTMTQTGHYEVFMDVYNQFMDMAKPLIEMLVEFEKTLRENTPDYMHDVGYKDVQLALALYHAYVADDYDTARQYMLKIRDNTSEKSSLVEIYMRLAAMSEFAKNPENASYYRALALQNVDEEKLSADDRIFVNCHRFNDAMRGGDNEVSLGLAREIYKANRKMLDTQFRLMSSADQERLMQSFGDPAWALSTLLERMPERISGEVYDAVVFRTGLQLRSQIETRSIIDKSDNPEIRRLDSSIKELRDSVSILQSGIMAQPDFKVMKTANEQISKLQFKIELKEQQLLDLTKSERADSVPDIRWQQVRDALKPGEAAVEFVYSYSRIMALVLKPGCESPVAVPLCVADTLKHQLDALNCRNSASRARSLYNAGKVDLYSLLWQPMERVLGDCSTVWLSAPGMLHSVAFNAISLPEGGYLMDRHDLRQLTTTAQLAMDRGREQQPRTALLVGDVLFSKSQAPLVGKEPDEKGVRGIDEEFDLADFGERGVGRDHFPYLPFTAREISDIEVTMTGLKADSLMRSDAREESLRALCATAPDVLHLATHGFFIDNEATAIKIPYMKRHGGGSSMTRSGVALADAETAWCGAELPAEADGILTAQEVAALNLRGTQLVALSACETALGSYSYEGVFGLTRGFKQAGAKSLLVSLWSVNDRSTALFMTTFYRHWLAGGDKHAAYRQAIATVRQKYPQPFYWAPFLLLD